MKILVINGPNMNLLGIREPEIYGKEDYNALKALITYTAKELNISAEEYQSNHEGDIVDKIQSAYGRFDGIVINAAAYTHTSIAIPDALKAVGIPAVEVHISDIDAREDYRKHSFLQEACLTCIKGKGIKGYAEAIRYLKEYLKG